MDHRLVNVIQIECKDNESESDSLSGKRTNYINWDETFMIIATAMSQRSKDPNTQVGCCIVDQNNHIMGTGYNGLPNGISDDEYPWKKSDNPLESKNTYVVHSEANGLLNSVKHDLRGCRMYVTLFPCNECTKLIIQKGISEIIYLSDKKHDEDMYEASRRMLDSVGIQYRQFDTNIIQFTTDFEKTNTFLINKTS
jgi:dCMP deaminase